MRSRLGSIEWKFPLVITAVVVVAIATFLWRGHLRLTEVVEDATAARLLSSARLVAGMLGDGNGATRGRMGAMAASPELADALRNDRNIARARQRLDEPSAAVDSSLVGRWLLDAAGRIQVASTRAIDRRLWTSDAAAAGRLDPDRLTVSPFHDLAGAPFFEVVIPVVAPGAAGHQVLGYLVEGRLARGRGVAAVRELAGTRTMLVGQPDAGVWTDFTDVVPGPPAITKDDSTAVFAESPRGPGIGALRPIAGTPWVVWVQVPRSEAMAPVRLWLRRVVPMSVLVVIAAVLLTWFASRRITGRLASLTRRIEALELGDAVSLPGLTGAPDEIGRLEGAFQHLLERARAHKRIESQVQESQKLEAVGRLAGGIAHDFNNMLTVVSNYGEMVRAELPPGSAADRDMEEVLRAAERASRLTRQLLTFSGRRVVSPVLLDLNAVIRDSQRMLERVISARVRFLWDLDETVGPIRADHGQIEQVLMNLVLNASDAMPDGGELMVRTSRARLDDALEHQGAATAAPSDQVARRDRPHVCLAVRDTGIGMDRATAARIFEPFFTTKAAGKGTGLGLATVHGIVTQIGGRIWVYSEPGRGTTFKLYFPTESGAADALPARPEPTSAPKGSGTILLVEDDAALREVTRRMLARIGYDVLVAEDAVTALNLLRENGAKVALVVTDVVMPGMSGAELAEKLERTRPGLPVMLMSGYHDLPAVHSHLSGTARTLLEKPFSVASLQEAVRAAIAAAS